MATEKLILDYVYQHEAAQPDRIYLTQPIGGGRVIDYTWAQALYDELYCQRGEAENRIKEAQVGLFATRTSCHVMRSNQLRMLLAALGYVLIERLRALALQGTALASAQVDTLRIKLLKVAAVVTRNTRRIRLYLASHWPSAQVFAHAMSQLRSP
jgi:hypothetical protein